MTYVLGDASTTSAPLRLQNTIRGDDFYSLARAYGVEALAIIRMQPALKTATISKKSIQNFVKALPGWSVEGGGMRPFSAADNPGTTDAFGKPEGYAIFTDDTQLMLPDMPRLDGKVPKDRQGGEPPTSIVDVPGKVLEAGGIGWVGAGILGLGALLLIGGAVKKRKR